MIVSFRGELEVDSKGTRDDRHYTRWHAASPGSRYTTLKDVTFVFREIARFYGCLGVARGSQVVSKLFKQLANNLGSGPVVHTPVLAERWGGILG